MTASIGTTPPLGEMLKRLFDDALLDVHTAIPARVEAFDAAAWTVEVVPLVRRQVEGDAGETDVEDLPKIVGVPVAFLGGGGLWLKVPVVVGDTVLLIFGERSLDNWKATGQLVDPQDERHHHLADAIALPGLFTPGAPPASGSPSGVIEIGFPHASDSVARASRVDAELAALKAAHDGHTHLVSGVTVGSSSVTSAGAAAAPAQATVASATVKVSP